MPINYKGGRLTPASFYFRGGGGVEGVGPEGQGEEVGVVLVQMAQVGQPLFDEPGVSSFHVHGQVLPVRRAEMRQVPALGQFLGPVKDRQQQVGEGVVLQQVGV